MRSLIARLYLFAPLVALVLCQLVWICFVTLGNENAGSPLVLKAAFPVLLLVGTFCHFRRR